MLHHLLADADDGGAVTGAQQGAEPNLRLELLSHVAHIVINDCLGDVLLRKKNKPL